MSDHPTPEFSRLISVDHVPVGGIEENLSATESERKALAERFELQGLDRLTAQLHLAPLAGQGVKVTGSMQADIRQRCVVTLEPLSGRIEQKIDVCFLPAALQEQQEDGSMDAGEGDIEFFTGGKIDLGELLAQHLGIAIDPHPRKEGAHFGAVEFGVAETRTNPFIHLVKKNHDP